MNWPCPSRSYHEGQYRIKAEGVDKGGLYAGAFDIFNSTTQITGRILTGTTAVGESFQISFDTSVFQEENGQVVLEAEHISWQIGEVNRAWISQTTQAGYVGSGYLSALPDVDQIYNTPTFTATSPRLEYSVNFTTTGTYYVWARGYAPNAAGDSLYVALDDQPATILTGFAPREWSWINLNTQGGVAIIEVTEPGVHTLHLWQREDGLRLDKILLTTNGQYNPSGNGPPESERN